MHYLPPPMGVEAVEHEQVIVNLHHEPPQNCPNPYNDITVHSTCCSIVDPNEVHPCNCEAVEVPTTTSSERSSSYNSCTLPLKPLKVVVKPQSHIFQESSARALLQIERSSKADKIANGRSRLTSTFDPCRICIKVPPSGATLIYAALL